MDQNKVLTGSSGNAWINGMLLATLKGIELKVTGSFEEQNFCGDNATYNKYTGWNGEGNVKFAKVDSTVIKLVADGFKTGNMPEIKIISKLTDKAAGKSERTAVTGVVFTEFFLAKYEAKTLVDEEIPLKFSDYEVLETI
jgi:hypothetical protein